MGTGVSHRETGLQAVARTALWTAAARARETGRPDRLFADPYAARLAGPDGPALLRHFHPDRAAPDGNPFLPVRTRWFDDFLARVVTAGCQLVGLGAGLDSRAYRLDWPPGVVLYELDQPAVLSYKEEQLAATGAATRCRRCPVPVDLATDWPAALRQAGFDPRRRSVWFAEGLLFYLPERLAGQLLRRAAGLAAPGSGLAADLIGTGAFRLRYLQPFLHKLARAGSPWRFGTDQPGRFVRECGWRVERLAEPGQPAANYGRWPERAGALAVANLPRSYLVAASRPGEPAGAGSPEIGAG